MDQKVFAAQLTSRQRDLLLMLLDAKRVLTKTELAEKLNLTQRQLNYDLTWVGENLIQNQAALHIVPRVGVELICSADQRRWFIKQIGSADNIQLILSGKQRQQLLLFVLLLSKQALTLEELQRKILVSRSTTIKDINQCEVWLESQGIVLERKPNFGFQSKCSEQLRRQVLTEMLWEGSLSTEPLIRITHFHGLELTLASERGLLPIVNEVFTQIKKWDIAKSVTWVSEIETALGGRFSDDAVLYLALALAIQAERTRTGNYVEAAVETRDWLKTQSIWGIAAGVVSQFTTTSAAFFNDEIAWLSAYLLAAPRNEGWLVAVDSYNPYTGLVDEMMQHIADSYGVPRISRDRLLREGVINHLVPVCFRLRFGLPMTALLPQVQLSQDYAGEIATVKQLLTLIQDRVGSVLPERESNGLAQLMRAAYMRECQDDVQAVMVVCPSGMATAQLLVARLKVYFPRLGRYRVVSLRELATEVIMINQIIIATVPLPEQLVKQARVIQVHPLLLPADIERITHEMR